ncbi:MAG: baseplate J/gp47 family protein, partial [Novosphingobium sp.]
VNRARVAQVRSTFVEREITGLAEARRAITGTPEEQILFLLSLALGDPRPGDPLPPFRKAAMTQARLADVARFIAFAPTALFMDLFELRALLARKARRAGEGKDWARINAFLEQAGQAKRGDRAWKLQTTRPGDFHGNLVLALGGEPDLGGLTEVASVDDLTLHLDRDDVREAIKTRLFLDVDRQFMPMMTLKRAIDADWQIVNGYLERAGRRKRPAVPGWTLGATDQAAFADNLAKSVGPIDYAAAGPLGEGVTDPDAYLARIGEVENWFFLPAEDVARLIATLATDETTPAGAQAWRAAYALLAGAHGRKVRAAEAADLQRLRLSPPAGADGPTAELEAALGPLPDGIDARMELLGRYASPEDVTFVRGVLAAAGRVGATVWPRVDAVLAEARRRRLRLPEPVAQKQHWRALWAYGDARAAGGDAGSWPCFGGVPADAGPGHPPAAIGWAVASPALALSTGRRQITVVLVFADDGGGALVAPVDDHSDSPRKLPFAATLSSGKDWIEPTSIAFADIDYRSIAGSAAFDAANPLIALQVTLVLDESAPAIAPSPASATFGASPWPVLRLMLRSVWDDDQHRFDTAYERFRGLTLAKVHVAVAVGRFVADGAPGVWPLQVETETGVVDGKKPFEPFGPEPSIGSELAIGHHDLLNKRLGRISLGLEWLGGPANLTTHYARYEPRSFTVQESLTDGGVRTTALGGPQPLFAGADTRPPVRIEATAGDAVRPDPVVGQEPREVRGSRRYLTLRLAGTDFGHHTYPSLVTSTSIALANALRQATAINTADFTINPPWTPKLKRIALDFTAAHEIDVAHYDPVNAIDRLFHVHAFGVAEATAGAWPMLPSYDEEGALYIGLTGIDAPQTVSLLFAAVEGGGAEERAGPLRWSYLDAAGWRDFAEPPDDDTEGLVRRGLVRFTLPPADPDRRLPAGFYWLRATMASGAANACDLIDIHAQAGSARFVDDGAQTEHYLAPLAAGTIRSLGDAAPGIGRVSQPYPTSGGRAAEGDQPFRTRAAERLRHKNRALTLWDYERLVLERFPQVHKVKCLPASGDVETLGTVRLVVIPDIRGEARADPFAPRAPARLLDEIAAWLRPLAPPTATIAVVHPRFVRVRVRVGVRFRAGGDVEFDRRRLAERLNRYLAPWAFDEGSDIAIGQRIDATSIVAFIDRLPFVDFVGGCRLFVSTDDGASYHPGDDGGESVQAVGEDGVLTPAARHEIDLISDDLFEQAEFTGIGYMKVELDFVVG